MFQIATIPSARRCDLEVSTWPAIAEIAQQVPYFHLLDRTGNVLQLPLCSERSEFRIEAEGSPNEIGSVYPNLLHCKTFQHKGSRIEQTNVEHDGVIFFRSYSVAGKERHLTTFSGIVRYVLHVLAKRSYQS